MESLQKLILATDLYANSVITNHKHSITYGSLKRHTTLLAAALRNIGIQKQERIVIIAEPSVEWILVDLTAILLGVTIIPMFPNISNETLAFQINDCKPQYLVAQDDVVFKKVQSITNYQFKNVFLIHKSNELRNFKTVWQMADEAKNTPHISPEPLAPEPISPEPIAQNLIATIVYTSGTSGMPRGVMLTYENLAAQIADIQLSFNILNNTDRALSILPLAHIFQRTITMFYISRGINIHIVNNMQKVLGEMKNVQPTLITVVPRVLEKIHSRIISQVLAKPFLVRKIFLPILEYSSTNVIKSKLLKVMLNLLFFKKIRAIFGGQIKLIVSGGAKLNAREEVFFQNAGLNILQGYGMTECSPVISSNTNANKKLFTVGKPFSSVDVKIEQNGEICIKGASVFHGYLNSDTNDTNQFFHTGDLGSIDAQGFLTVTGRLKEQFKNANGKYINPIKIENLLNAISGVDASCIVAEGMPYTVAVIFSQLNTAVLQKYIAEVNQHLEHHEQIQYFHITQEKPTVENNVITPSLKLRRNDIMKKYSKEIQELYRHYKG